MQTEQKKNQNSKQFAQAARQSTGKNRCAEFDGGLRVLSKE